MLRYFSVSEIPPHKNSATVLRRNQEKIREPPGAKRLKTHFFPEGRFMIFAGSRPSGMLQKS
jgi:hypothetical protein